MCSPQSKKGHETVHEVPDHIRQSRYKERNDHDNRNSEHHPSYHGRLLLLRDDLMLDPLVGCFGNHFLIDQIVLSFVGTMFDDPGGQRITDPR